MSWSISPMPWLVEEVGEEGPYQAEVYFAVAVNNEGRRFAHDRTFRNQDEVFDLVRKIELHIKDHPEWTPKPEHWREIDPVYGSARYETHGLDSDPVAKAAAYGDKKLADAIQWEIDRGHRKPYDN